MKLHILKILKKSKIDKKHSINEPVICKLTGDKCIHSEPDDMDCNRYCKVYTYNMSKAFELMNHKKNY